MAIHAATSPSHPHREASHDVLVVDDDPGIRNVIEEFLGAEGHRVVTAADGADGLAKLKEPGHPCVILLDLMMPVMDGATFIERQSNDRAIASIPVVVMSAHERLTVPVALIGTMYWLAKPFDLRHLVYALERSCGHATHARSNAALLD